MNTKQLAIMAIPVFAAILLGSAIAPHAFAAPAEKVAVCHVNSGNDSVDLGQVTAVIGNVMEVSENAVASHVDNHGDSITFLPITEDERDEIEAFFGVSLPNADCFFFVAN